MVPILASINPAHIQSNVDASKFKLRNDVFEALRALRTLVQPCRQLGLPDVYGIDRGLMRDAWGSLMSEFPNVCASASGV